MWDRTPKQVGVILKQLFFIGSMKYLSGKHYQVLTQRIRTMQRVAVAFYSVSVIFGSSGLSRGGAQRDTQLNWCESALRRLDHFTENN